MSDLTRFMFRAPSTIQAISVDEIDPDPNQPRKHFDEESLKALAASLELVGQLQPILVRKVNERYMIVVGERRWRAQKLRGHPTIEAKVLADDIPLALAQPAENANREDLTPQELLDAIESATAAGFSKTQIAAALGLGTATVARYRKISGDDEAAAIVRQGGGFRTALSLVTAAGAPDASPGEPEPSGPLDVDVAPAEHDDAPTTTPVTTTPGVKGPRSPGPGDLVGPFVASREVQPERDAGTPSSSFRPRTEEAQVLVGRLKDLIDEVVQEILARPEPDRGRCLSEIARVLGDLAPPVSRDTPR